MFGRLKQILMLLRIMSNPQVTKTPILVLNKLKDQGKKRLPSNIQTEIGRNKRIKTSTFKFAKELLSSECISRHEGKFVINSFLPPFPSKAYDRMFTNLLSGRKLSPVSTFIAITKECPYNCWHCSFKGRNHKNLTTDRQLLLIDELCELGTSIIGFTGGEPLLHKDITSLINRASINGAETILFTTGYKLTPEKALELKKSGLWAICFSLDSHIPEIHNQLRGHEDAFNEVLKAVKAAKGANLYTMFSSVATPQFMKKEGYKHIYKIAQNMNINEYRIIEAMPCGKLLDNEMALITKDDVKKLCLFHKTINSKSPKTKVCAFNQIESPSLFGCGAGTQHMFIDNAGEVCPCDFTPLSFGNITKEPLLTIWLKMNEAFKLPRRQCFIQKNHKLISQKIHDNNFNVPLTINDSLEICQKCPFDEMPDYFKMVYKP